MKKAIGIIILGLFWCSVGFAQVIKYECTNPDFPKMEYFNIQINLANKSAATQFVWSGEYHEDTYTIESADSQKVHLLNHDKSVSYPRWHFYYATNQKAYTPGTKQTDYYNCKSDKNLMSSSSSSLINLCRLAPDLRRGR